MTRRFDLVRAFQRDDASAHNLRDMGFRQLYETAYFIRDTQ